MTDWSEPWVLDHEPTDPQWNDFARKTMQIWGISNGTYEQVSRLETVIKYLRLIGTTTFAIAGIGFLVAALLCVALLIIAILSM